MIHLFVYLFGMVVATVAVAYHHAHNKEKYESYSDPTAVFAAISIMIWPTAIVVWTFVQMARVAYRRLYEPMVRYFERRAEEKARQPEFTPGANYRDGGKEA